MLQTGAAGRFLGYGGMREAVSVFFTLSFTQQKVGANGGTVASARSFSQATLVFTCRMTTRLGQGGALPSR